MEKENETKVVDMKSQDNKEEQNIHAGEGASVQRQKLSYEQLDGVCRNLVQENEKMRGMLMKMNYENVFRRLDYLFKVMEYPDAFSDKFYRRCTEEIERLMTVEGKKPKQENGGHGHQQDSDLRKPVSHQSVDDGGSGDENEDIDDGEPISEEL